MVPFNEDGLFHLLGGREKASRRLDSLFHDANGGSVLTGRTLNVGMDNEPSLEAPWLYDFSGEAYKTQETVRAILDRLWKVAPDGIPGNDDLGEMSSWYVWAALGLYPEIPGRAELVLASPLFAQATIHRKLGDIRIATRREDDAAAYIRRVRVDGHAWPKPWLPAAFVRHGGTLTFELHDTPDRSWGAAAADARHLSMSHD